MRRNTSSSTHSALRAPHSALRRPTVFLAALTLALLNLAPLAAADRPKLIVVVSADQFCQD